MEAYRTIDILDKDMEITIKALVKKQAELEKSEKRYRIVAESVNDIIWEGDLVNRKRYFSEKVYDILGYKPKELERFDKWFEIVHPDDIDLLKKGIKEQIENKVEIDKFEYRVRCKDGKYKWILSNTKCEFDMYGRAIATIGTCTDITELKEQQKIIRDLAYYDTVTGLPNRANFMKVITEKIKSANKNKDKFAMIFIDLDNFKFVNDSYGHLVGDKLLVEVGKRLNEMCNDEIMSFRLGGDEFIVLIENIDNQKKVANYSKYLHKTMASPFYINGYMFHITLSSGIVLYPENGRNFEELLRNADTAMYKSKELGKGTYSFYDLEMGEATKEKIEIQRDLNIAIKNKEFELYYQPIFNIDKEKITGCEALIRWIHPDKGIISPGKFINIAEENGAIIEIGKLVFESACEYAKRMHCSGYKEFYVSVNISPYQLLYEGFTNFIIDTIDTIGVKPENIVIEITESVLIESLELAIDKLKELKSNKIKIALDDFGCGYSSLTYLKMLPIDRVKIDKSFIDDIKSENDTKNMTNIIILMAKQLGLDVVAEGVEEKYQLDYLKKHSCDMLQGYFISKPMPEEEFLNLINNKSNRYF